MTIGVPKGQSYAQHRERMGIERAQRNAANRAKRDEWANWLRDVLLELDAQLTLDVGKTQ
jgi:hypothetical protein